MGRRPVNKLPFGLKNSQLVHISDVEPGLKCECFCPACRHPLVAKKGRIKIHHFAHDRSSQCKHAYETSIHLAAKKVIEQAGYIQLPNLEHEYEIINTRQQARLSFDQTRIYFDKIYLESKFHDIVPDILIEKDGRLLCIEIFVTHEVDEQKRKKVEGSKLSAIEIDLSKIDRSINFESLKEIVVNSVENKRWLFNSKFDSKRSGLYRKILRNSIRRKIIPHGLIGGHVDDCPRPPGAWNGKPCANVRHDCFYCKYFVIPESGYPEEGVVYCIGHKTEEEINNLLGSEKTKA